ncbi:hypothetical protein GWC95_05885 [Sediminibacterium roseum]|uniref:Avirulence protein n=1 Tax=Sediminibacterium roseum TaxID=1978412 RepID=A0ABW9ZT27_9BACT|nr:DUF6055 domain-containing protein [Sediminibacterium roseum]NCI49444.1 hypothetical protein [Sediminibacterium roseum]
MKRCLVLFSAMMFGAIAPKAQQAPKELLLADTIYRIPAKNDYTKKESDYSFDRMVQGDNIAIFWHREFGDKPWENADPKKRFDPKDALSECERFYNFYVNDLKFVVKGKSFTDKYKMVLFVINGEGGTAFGGGTGNVGMLWTPAARMNKAPYGALAHELGHSFQYIASKDNGRGPRGTISEMSAQYLLWQVYPEWMTFENYHLVDFLKGTHYAFLHGYNTYHSPYVFEYWHNKRGKEFFGNFFRATQDGDDPVMTYKRFTNQTQEEFNDEMFDACRRFITWDMPRIEQVARPYANQHFTTLNALGDNWYQIAKAKCPQNYGYNGIRLKVPGDGGQVEVDFKGVAGTDSFNAVKVDKAGWRYGFVAYQKDGKRVYGEMNKKPEGKAKFRVPKNTEYLWLVVMGAPTEHWPIAMRRRSTDGTPPPPVLEEQWPYQVKFKGTAPDEAMVKAK